KNRPAAGQVGRAPVAEPACAQANVLILRDGEFGFRLQNVASISVQIVGEAESIANVPAVAQQERPILAITTAQRQFYGLVGAPWEVEKLQELEVFAPVILFAVVLDNTVELFPVTDGRERVDSRNGVGRPKIEHDGLSGRLEVKSIGGRQLAVGVAIVFG